MSITRKHYVRIAALIAAVVIKYRAGTRAEHRRLLADRLRAVELTVGALCQGLEEDNPAFDRGKFRKACGLW